MAKFQSGHVLFASGGMPLQFVNAHQRDFSFTALSPRISRFYNSILRRMRTARRRLRKKAPVYDDRRLEAQNQRYVFVLLEHKGGGIE